MVIWHQALAPGKDRKGLNLNPFPTPEISSRAQSTPCTLRPATAPRPLGLGGRPRAHPDRTRARYNRTRVGEV